MDLRKFKAEGSPVNGFGLEALNKARAAGLKDKEIVELAKNQNLVMGEKALLSIEACC